MLKEARNLFPMLKESDIEYAYGDGGIRPQLVNMKTGELEMGVGKIPGNGIIFDITPSPGASDSVRNALVNAVYLTKSPSGEDNLDTKAFENEFPGSLEALGRVRNAAEELAKKLQE